MQEFVQFLIEVLGEVLPPPWNVIVVQALIILGIIAIVHFFIRRFLLRYRLFIIARSNKYVQQHVTEAELMTKLSQVIEEVQRLHPLRGEVAGERPYVGPPQRLGEGLGSIIGSNGLTIVLVTAATPLLGIAQQVISLILPRLELEVRVHLDEKKKRVTLTAILRRGREEIGNYLFDEDGDILTAMPSLIRQMIFQVLFDLARRSDTGKRSYVSAANAEAFRALTLALEAWQNPNFDINHDYDKKSVEKLLREAVQHDPRYALAYYNLGVLHYIPLLSAEEHEIARKDFENAAKIAHEVRITSKDEPLAEKEAQRVEGMAYLGMSRCYSQDYHRWGDKSPEVVQKARETAAQAVELLHHSLESMYAQAFAWHCTETYDDIQKGAKIYEDIIARAGVNPEPYDSVFLNLGYIQMKAGEISQDRQMLKEADVWFTKSETNLKQAIRYTNAAKNIDKFANANLGNLYRLRQRFDDAISFYCKALDGNPEASNYINGLNELSLVYLDRNSGEDDFKKALHYHELALQQTTDHNYLIRLMTDFVNIIANKDTLNADAAKAALYEEKSKENANAQTWIKKLRTLLLPEFKDWDAVEYAQPC